MSNNLYLFANNNGRQAENNGSYRLYDMKIAGDSEGVNSGVDYVDYLEGDGNSWIDTGIIPHNNMSFYCDYYLVTYAEVYFGSPGIRSYGVYQSTNRVEYGGITNINFNDYKYNHRYTCTLTPTGYKVKDITDGRYDKNKYGYTPNVISQYNMTLFGEPRSADGMIQNKVKGRIYEFKILDNDNLIMHLRPCLDTQGVPCMYDEVSKRYFYNRGTGTFKYKKTLRDFQPVLDSNNIPCLLDKINNKFYYNNSGEVFKTIEKPKYKKLACLIGDQYNYINIENQTIDQDSIVEVGWEIVDTSQSQQCFILKGLYTLQRGSNDICYLYNSPVRKEIIGAMTSKKNKHDIKITKDKLTLDSNEVDLVSKGFPQTYSITGDLKLFYYSEMGIKFDAKSKISYFKLYHSDQLVLDLIPVLDQNNAPCMYDKVSDQFFYNQGTGTFEYEIEELEGECYEIACTTEDIVNNINPLLVNVKFEVLDNKTISMPKSGGWTTMQFDGKSNKGLKLKANTKYTIIVKPISAYTFNKNTACNVCVTDKRKYILNLDKPTIVETGYKGEFLLYPHISDSPVEEIGIIVLEGEYPDAVYSSFDNIQTSTHAEYIESNGTQYIDTEVVPNSNTDIDMTCRAVSNGGYILNGLQLDTTYKYNGTDTTAQPNLTASTGATLTMGSQNIAYLTEAEIAQAVLNGWTIQ